MTTEKEAPGAQSEAKEEKQPRRAAPAKAQKTLAKDELIHAIKGMTVLELSELVKALETEFGVSAASPMAVAASAPAAAAAPEEKEEKTEFTVFLKEIGANKINVIKAVREVTALGLKEAKELVESAPKAVKEKASKAEAETAREKLAAAGAVVEIQ